MSNGYVVRNRGRVTASKLKTFEKNPREYYLQYEEEVEIKEIRGRHFYIGDAIDCLLSYWKKRFLKKYYIEEKGLVKAMLVDKLLERFRGISRDPQDLVTEKRRLKDLPLDDLREEYYSGDGKARVRLTPGEGEMIIGMYREVIRVDDSGGNLTDYYGKYSKQVVIEAEYNGIPLRWMLDRFIFVDKQANRYTVKRVDKYIRKRGKKQRLTLAKKHSITGYIRDWKTTRRIDPYTFQYDIEQRGYMFSMAFYSALVMAKYWVESDVILDFMSKEKPYPYFGYQLEREELKAVIQNRIKPSLHSLQNCYATGERPLVSVRTGKPLTREDLVGSPYYQYYPESVQKEFIS